MVHESVFAHKGLIGKLPKNIQLRYKKYQPKLPTRRKNNNKFLAYKQLKDVFSDRSRKNLTLCWQQTEADEH